MQTTSITTVNNLPPGRQKLLEVLQEGKFESVTALCEAAGVSRNVYYDAIQDESFVAQLFKSSTGLIYASIPHIVEKIVKQAKSGSYMHQKMLLEMVKLYQSGPQVAVQVNNNSGYSQEDIAAGTHIDDAILILKSSGLSKEEINERLGL